jgi:hypothetical protein
VLKELVPMLACLNSSNEGLSGFWSSAVRYNRMIPYLSSALCNSGLSPVSS